MNHEQLEEFLRTNAGLSFNDEEYNLTHYDDNTAVPVLSPILRIVFEKRIQQRIDASYPEYVYRAVMAHIKSHQEEPKCLRVLIGMPGMEKNVFTYLFAHLPDKYKGKLYVRQAERDIDTRSVIVGIDTKEELSKRTLWDDMKVDFSGNEPIFLDNTQNGTVKIKIDKQAFQSFPIRRNKKNCFPKEAAEYLKSQNKNIRCSLWSTHTDKNRPYEETNWILMCDQQVFYIYSSDQVVEITPTIKVKVQV